MIFYLATFFFILFHIQLPTDNSYLIEKYPIFFLTIFQTSFAN